MVVSTSTTTGRILHLQRLSTEDGPGIRTTVFLKHCPLRCAWCHNPESIDRQPQIQWFSMRCLNCGTCVSVCPQQGLALDDDGIHIDRENCPGCGICADACPGGALELLGTEMQVETLVNELLKDRAYYEKSGGGVTFSGGEPLMQPDFTAAVFRRLQTEGIHTALDTCGLVAFSRLEQALAYTNLVLYDVKFINSEAHRRYTGQSNDLILKNLLVISDLIRADRLDLRLWVRTPLIPGATAAQENLKDIGVWLAEHLPDVVERWELCAFNNLCRDQYTRLGLEWAYASTPLMTSDELDDLLHIAQSTGLVPERIVATGATRFEG